MRKAWGYAFSLALGAVLLTQYTNCDHYSDNTLYGAQALSAVANQCSTTDTTNGSTGCTPSPNDTDYLNLRISGSDPAYYSPYDTYVTLAGDCSWDTFTSNYIRDTEFVGDTTGTPVYSNSNASCVDGHFTVIVPIYSSCYSQRCTVQLELIGLDANKKEYSNAYQAKKKIGIVVDMSKAATH